MPPRTTKNSFAPDPSELTENEGGLLAMIRAHQPLTAHQLLRLVQQSPVESSRSSKGGLYPAVARLRERGYVVAEAVPGDRRGSEVLSCSTLGEAAIRQWVKDLRDNHFAPFDPLRSKVLAFELLTRDEQVEWIVDAKAHLSDRLSAIESDNWAPGSFGELARDGAIAATKLRLQWLDKVLQRVVKNR